MAKDRNGRAVDLYILDLGNQQHHPGPGQWDWNTRGAKKPVVIHELTLNQLHRKVSPCLMDCWKLREIIGALENAGAENDTGDHTPSDVTHMRSDDELDGFLHLTEAKPVEILVVLHSAVGRANSSPSAGANKDNYYFKLGKFCNVAG